VDLEEYEKKINNILKNESLTDKVIKYLNSTNEILSEDEYVRTEEVSPKMPVGMSGFYVSSTKYFVNLKISTITIVLLLLDIKITAGVASTLGGLCGRTGKAITSVSEEEKCIILDTRKRKSFFVNQLNYENKECTRNDLKCKFRAEGKCCRNIDEIDNLLENLISNNVIEKNGDSYKLAL